MAYLPQQVYDKADAQAKKVWDQQISDHGRMTNMKRTLAHSGTALGAYMEWYPLKDEVAEFVGERAALLFAHAISVQSDCIICSTFFRRIFIDAGENPDEFQLNEKEQLLVNYGRALVKNPNHIPKAIMSQLNDWLSPKELVNLTAFGGIMIATNIFNDALQIDLDEYLFSYRKKSTIKE